jgi:hypothetical protein
MYAHCPLSGDTARTIVRAHYGLKRAVTDAEVNAEIANLRRRGLHRLDDQQHALAAALNLMLTLDGEHSSE